jgi:hypothetical protein
MASEGKKKLRQIHFRLELTGTGPPMLPKPRVEVSTKDAGEDSVLELVPEDTLYTQHVGDSGKMERLPDAWLSRYCFRVRIDGKLVVLEQVADKYGHRQPFSFHEPPYALSLQDAGPIRLEIGKPRRIFYNVPGGGPMWTLELIGIE